MKILGVSGSLRKASFNTALMQAAAALAPAGVAFETATIHGIPLYDADEERATGIPAAVAALKARWAEADGVLLFSPEYNNSLPGVFKNAIDWLSRPPADLARLFKGKPVAVLGASPGGFGTILAQNAWLPVLRTLGTEPWFGGRLMVAHAGDMFDASGALVDESTRDRLRDFVSGFAAFVRASRR
ncbi:MAG: NAD(P)H-dependent oxidoreductase [Proteobacteria bacterium]|nr:NAD(P)H-dependent oxidoreductase [Pseudomonadota bacterium]